MTLPSYDRVLRVTSELSQEMLGDFLPQFVELTYNPVPHPDNGTRPVWRVRFDAGFDTHVNMGLDINDEVVLGRRQNDEGDIVTLFSYRAAEQLGVSRRHALLRPTDAKLYVVDLGSTNGTRLNGRQLGKNIPYSISNGARLTLGRLDFIITIIQTPPSHTSILRNQADLADILPPIGRAISSQLSVGDVLKQAVELTRLYSNASEASIWLIDEHSGELFLEAQQGMDDIQIRRLPVADTIAGEVVTKGKPRIANRENGHDHVKVKTGYLVEAVIYVPLTLGGVTFGVLSAAHRGRGNLFSQHEEKLLTAIADFTAVAVQNARTYEAVEQSLNRHTKIVTAMRYALSYDIKNLINPAIGYTSILAGDETLDEATAEIIHTIADSSNKVSEIVDRLVEVAALCEGSSMQNSRCHMVEIATKAVGDLQHAAQAKSVYVDTQMMGEPYFIKGNGNYLYRSVYNMLDNAIKFSPTDSHVSLTLIFSESEVVIQVRDTGPGIAEDDLPHIFDRYIRSNRSPGGEISLGLGLEIVRATAEAHKGTVSARNLEGQGAEFTMTLPASLRIP